MIKTKFSVPCSQFPGPQNERERKQPTYYSKQESKQTTANECAIENMPSTSSSSTTTFGIVTSRTDFKFRE